MSKKTILYISQLMIGSLGVYTCYNLNKLGIIPYYIQILILLGILVLMASLYIVYKISSRYWFKEIFDNGYIKYKELYDLYRQKVIENGQQYDIFVEEYCDNHINFLNNNSGDISENNTIQDELSPARIKGLFTKRKDLIDEYFQKPSFRYSDYLSMHERYCKEKESVFLNDTDLCFLEKVKDQISVCYEDKGKKMDGDRLFGYYLISLGYFSLSASQCKDKWEQYIGYKNGPCDYCRYIKDPSDYGGKESNIKATIEALERVKKFFVIHPNDSVIKVIDKDIQSLSSFLPLS